MVIARTSPRRVTIVAYPRVQSLDVTGPYEVFALANRFALDPPHGGAAVSAMSAPYELEIVARPTSGPRSIQAPRSIQTSSGMCLGVDRWISASRDAGELRKDNAIDTVIVAGGEGTEAAASDVVLLEWLAGIAGNVRRVASVCSGSFVLAAAGLLDGKRATTHWSEGSTLRRLFPEVIVEDDPIFVRDGSTYTSAGVTAGMDLALALVEEDLGRDIALAVSRWLVMFVQRPGGQSQFSAQLAAQIAERRPLRDLQAWVSDHPEADLSVAALADRVAMSPRHFARVFRGELGVTPGQYVEEMRVEVARRLLETTDQTIETVSRRAGFGTVETMQRAFQRKVNTTPSQYRRHFSRPSARAVG